MEKSLSADVATRERPMKKRKMPMDSGSSKRLYTSQHLDGGNSLADRSVQETSRIAAGKSEFDNVTVFMTF